MQRHHGAQNPSTNGTVVAKLPADADHPNLNSYWAIDRGPNSVEDSNELKSRISMETISYVPFKERSTNTQACKRYVEGN